MYEAEDLWVFGYGSLMWRPGFEFEERSPALVRGYHRSLCIYSHVHRGTPEKPGVVLGLDRGGACKGLAFRVAGQRREETLSYLREREQVTAVYLEASLSARLPDGRDIPCIAYVVDRTHPQYAGRLPASDLLTLVAQGHGLSGSNLDYVRSTHDHLLAAGIVDPALSLIADHLPEPGVRRFGDFSE
jgi:glutathione-specific gamma-glutamylcyclotransferase